MFKKINSAKTGFHHLGSLGVPPENLEGAETLTISINYSIHSTCISQKMFKKINSAKTGFHHLGSLGVPPEKLGGSGNPYNKV